MALLDKILPAEQKKRKWASVGLTVLIAAILTLWGIYGMRRYGIALFVLTPLFIGAGSTFFYGYKRNITWRDAWTIGFLSLGVFGALLLLCAIEGIICIAMAAPLAVLLTFAGSFLGYIMLGKGPASTHTTLIILIALVPTTAFIEKDNVPGLVSVTTSVEIAADAETVWKNVIEFPQLDEPTEFIFKTGIAYPVNASIDGRGAGAVRHCNFTTGSFVEPVTIWDEPRLLKFDVAEQPAPMKELSFWDIDAPHLHDYFVSKQGQFKLTQLPNGHTLLEGTTWYYHNIQPAFYWKAWSDHIIHTIHERVLAHIKNSSEKSQQLTYRAE